ncbi:MAG: response regulator [Methanoculleaceae archaeon]
MKKKILVIDDDIPTLEIMELLLRKIGMEPVMVQSGPEALDLLRNQEIDLIILDVMMAPVDGWQLLDILKADESFRKIPILLFTAKHVWPEETEKYGAKVEGILHKPITLAELQEAVERVFSERV